MNKFKLCPELIGSIIDISNLEFKNCKCLLNLVFKGDEKKAELIANSM